MRAHWRGGIVPLDEAMFGNAVDGNQLNNIIDIVEFMTMVEVQRDETATMSLDLDIDVDKFRCASSSCMPMPIAMAM